MQQELEELRAEKEQYRQDLESVRQTSQGLINKLEAKYQDLDGGFRSQLQVNGELSQRLAMLERMYAATRAELSTVTGSVGDLTNTNMMDGSNITTKIIATASHRSQMSTGSPNPSAKGLYSTWHKSLRSPKEPKEEINSVSMLWDAHTDLGTRIDELIQACMTGRAHASLGEDILRNRVLQEVQEVSQDYNEVVVSGLEDCKHIVDQALKRLEGPLGEEPSSEREQQRDEQLVEQQKQKVFEAAALTPKPPETGENVNGDESDNDTVLETIGDGGSDVDVSLNDMSSIVPPPNYAAPPPPSVRQEEKKDQRSESAAASAARVGEALKATSLKAFIRKN